LEEVFERDGTPPRRQVQVSQAVDGVLGDRWLTREVCLLQVVVEVYVANEWRNGGTFLDIVEAEDPGSEGCVSHVQADAHRKMVYGRDLLGQLGGPDGVVVDGAADDG
jgi:hypothetical protein